VGKWDDSVRYVHANMNETPRIQLKGTREVRPRPWAHRPSTFLALKPTTEKLT